MIILNNPSSPSPPELRVLSDLVALLANPEAARPRPPRPDLRCALQAIDQATAERAEVAKLRTSTERNLAEARTAHDMKLRDDRATFAEDVARRTAELDARERHIADLTAAAETAKAAAERRLADLDRRLKIITEPAGTAA